MSSHESTTAARENEKTKKRFPKKLTICTLLVVLGLTLLHWQSENLNEWINLNPGPINVVTIVLTILTVLAWGLWGLFQKNMRWVGVLILVAPATFLTFYSPNFGGDANIQGWKPRFWREPVDFVKVSGDTQRKVDLKNTTPLDFPQFLGQHRNGRVRSVSLIPDWSALAPKQLWKQPIGEGWSGFAAVNGFAITQEQRGAAECVTCYDINNGKLQWIHQATRRHEDMSGLGKVGPRATPTIDEGLVYVTSGTGVVDCLDGATGQLVWSADVPRLVGIMQIERTNSLGLKYTMEDSHLTWGRAGSPLIFENKVIVPAGGPNTEENDLTTTLIAFDKKTGAEIWRGGNRMVAYGSPTMATILGEPQILLVAEDHAVGHDPETGKEIWSHERSGTSNADANCSQVTVISESRLILSKGYNMGGEMIELVKLDEAIKITSLKKDPRILKTKLTSPVVYQGHTYSLSDGYLECVEIETFRRKWKQRGRFGNGQLLLVDDKLLVHSETGSLFLIAADPDKYRELGSIKTIAGTCWNTLCLYGDQLLVRSELAAACFHLPTSHPGNASD